VDHIDLSVYPGERFALLGHNGAGKTTLIKLMLGLCRPTKGEILVQGRQITAAGVSQLNVGYLPESVSFHDSMSGREVIRFYARLKRRSYKECDELLEQVGLTAAAGQRVRTYSKGMRQRLGLAQALLGNPSLLFLDEPTSGLDPALRSLF
jgi:Cu-processing system ATP-binding protein